MDGLSLCSVPGRQCQELCQSNGKLQVVRVEWHRVCVLLVLPVLGEAVCLSYPCSGRAMEPAE